MLPLHTCVHCGTPAVRIYLDASDRWQALAPSIDRKAYLLSLDHECVEEVADEEDDQDIEQDCPEASLCLSCRAFHESSPLAENCCAKPLQIRLRIVLSEEDGLLKVCPTCGGQRASFPSVLRQFSTGEDAATAVLAEAVVRGLPHEDVSRPAHGRRLLAFSDSRQRAAHFAPYLARTTAESQYMQPLLEAIREAAKASGEDGASFDDVSERFLKIAQKQSYLVIRKTTEDGEFTSTIKRPAQIYKDDREILKRECLISLLTHFTAPVRARSTLPGMALASVCVDWNDEQRECLPERLPKIFENGAEPGFAVL